ncbi:hypothetical protein GC425_03885 [Corynebacterium sp. zg254]|uniref:hypothetical protein n=1 Tax=Corynebacterium sp. zg254 TaxID=2656645 RepID=UPI0021509DE5|nr:hypothetical protein [Corynebacterium sp. zg254]MCR5914010.1 hypothetical protein [Corynebacterium sp. zg254]
MLGFGKDSKNQARDEQDRAGQAEEAPTQQKVAELLLTAAITTGLRITPVSSCAFEISGFECPDVMLHAAVETNPLRVRATTHWLGTISGEEDLEVNLAVNEWNANFSWPRLQVAKDARGNHRVSADTLLLGSAGWTVAQLSDWILHAAGGAVGVARYAESVWPGAEVDRTAEIVAEVRAELPGNPNEFIDGTALVDPAAVRSLESVSAQLEPLATQGNAFHLLPQSDDLEPVNPERLAQTFVGGDDWREALVDSGEGVRHASFDWKGDRVDMTVHNTVLTVETGVVLGETPEDLLEAMLARITELNFSEDGTTVSLVNIGDQEPQWLLRSLFHVAAKTGMTLGQLERYGLGGAVLTRRSVAAFHEEFSL